MQQRKSAPVMVNCQVGGGRGVVVGEGGGGGELVRLLLLFFFINVSPDKTNFFGHTAGRDRTCAS